MNRYGGPGPDADTAELDAWDNLIHAQFEPDEPYCGARAETGDHEGFRAAVDRDLASIGDDQ